MYRYMFFSKYSLVSVLAKECFVYTIFVVR